MKFFESYYKGDFSRDGLLKPWMNEFFTYIYEPAKWKYKDIEPKIHTADALYWNKGSVLA